MSYSGFMSIVATVLIVMGFGLLGRLASRSSRPRNTHQTHGSTGLWYTGVDSGAGSDASGGFSGGGDGGGGGGGGGD
ncbi:hypothetical protein GCM10007094_37430 [Pseudovibrio japonicus]|uniref:Uncharacterized protein n=1 Tax=Pseudovibrio japonicus TaxID=366534 RepID=A0ABQ3EPA4_9HYPH|nr:hypothetical protein [Pseudovibrio japonicus]GHB44607.1 hypothetical protein GCM10007094_37430 [Pseudovibrio japonicus]